MGLKEKDEAVVAAAAGLEDASAAVAVGAGGAPTGPAVIGPSLPLALAMPLPEPEPLPLPLEVVRGLLPPLRIPELLSLRPRPRPPRPEPPPGLMALEVSREHHSVGTERAERADRSPWTSIHRSTCSPLSVDVGGSQEIGGAGRMSERGWQTDIAQPRSTSSPLTMEAGGPGGKGR